MTEKRGTFVVSHADTDSAVLRDVDDGQVHTLADNPGVDEGDVVEGTVAPDPPMEVTWSLVEVETRQQVSVVDSDLDPTGQAREAGTDLPEGEVARIERAGEGEVHVLSVPDADAAAADILGDPTTVERAARLSAVRVEVRREEGLVTVRYLPD
jgi:hypothetical protein